MEPAKRVNAACHARISTVSAPLFCLDIDDVDGPVDNAVDVPDVGVEVVLDEFPRMAADADDVADTLEAGPTALVPFAAPVELPPAPRLEELTRAPVPQGIAAFEPGCTADGGGVDCPLEDAMVNRVVQVLFWERAEVNW